MKINVTNVNFGIKAPKISPKKIKEEKLPDFFRDNELFDSAKDSLDMEYCRYDANDIPVGIHKEFRDADISDHEARNFFPSRMPYQKVVDLYLSNDANSIESIPNLFEKINGGSNFIA